MADKEFDIYKNIKILLLEDNPDDATLVKSAILDSDFIPEFFWAEDRASFINLLKKVDPHIVLADYSLPSFTGFEALQIVREFDDQLPFIFVTGSLGDELAAETILNGASGFVLKSNFHKLPGAIQKALQNKTIWMSQSLKRASRKVEKNLEKNIETLNKIKKYLDGNRNNEIHEIKNEVNELIKDLKELEPPSKK